MNALLKFKDAIGRFSAVTEEEWEDFSQGLFIKTYKKNDFLLKAGQVENYIYLIITGATRSFFIKDGKEFTVDFQFQDDFVTAYYSLITREPSMISIKLLQDSALVGISYKSLYDFYLRHPKGERIGRLMAEHQYLKRLRKEMDLLSCTASERYAALFKKNPALILSASVKHLSSYLGVHPESLSRIRKQHGKS